AAWWPLLPLELIPDRITPPPSRWRLYAPEVRFAQPNPWEDGGVVQTCLEEISGVQTALSGPMGRLRRAYAEQARGAVEGVGDGFDGAVAVDVLASLPDGAWLGTL